jgi:hypothetical protein
MLGVLNMASEKWAQKSQNTMKYRKENMQRVEVIGARDRIQAYKDYCKAKGTAFNADLLAYMDSVSGWKDPEGE